jgi:hypothetical protein
MHVQTITGGVSPTGGEYSEQELPIRKCKQALIFDPNLTAGLETTTLTYTLL